MVLQIFLFDKFCDENVLPMSSDQLTEREETPRVIIHILSHFIPLISCCPASTGSSKVEVLLCGMFPITHSANLDWSLEGANFGFQHFNSLRDHERTDCGHSYQGFVYHVLWHNPIGQHLRTSE